MGKEKKPEYWIIDDITFHKLQQLKQFVDFVAQLKIHSSTLASTAVTTHSIVR